MSDSFKNSELVAELVESFCQNDITPEQAAQLDELLRTDKEARRYYLCYLSMHAGLRHLLGRGSGKTELPCTETLLDHFESRSELPCPPLEWLNESLDTDPFASSLPGSLKDSPNQTVLGEINQSFMTTVQHVIGSPSFFTGAMLFSLSLFVLMMVLLFPSSEIQNEPIASVSQTLDVVWNNNTGGGDLKLLCAGKRLELESGLVQIRYQNGVLVNLQGPCVYVVSGPNRGLLVQGTVSALAENVLPGFAIWTPIGKVTDVGTEFGIKVAENQDTEVQAFRGLIKLDVTRAGYKSIDATMPAQSLELRKGEAVEVDAHLRIVRPVSYSPDRFARTYEKLEPCDRDRFVDDVELRPDTKPIRATLLATNEVFVADMPAPEPGADVLVIVSTKINDPQGGPEGGIGFRLQRNYRKGIVIQQYDSKPLPTTIESSRIYDPTPGQQLRLVIERNSETEFTFYYQVSGIRTKIVGPIANPELRGIDQVSVGLITP